MNKPTMKDKLSAVEKALEVLDAFGNDIEEVQLITPRELMALKLLRAELHKRVYGEYPHMASPRFIMLDVSFE